MTTVQSTLCVECLYLEVSIRVVIVLRIKELVNQFDTNYDLIDHLQDLLSFNAIDLLTAYLRKLPDFVHGLARMHHEVKEVRFWTILKLRT